MPKLASKKFIDDISLLAVEQCLISRLPALFPSETILDLRDDEIAHIATESHAMMLQRIRYNEKLAALEGAKDDLKQLDIHRTLDLVSPPPGTIEQVHTDGESEASLPGETDMWFNPTSSTSRRTRAVYLGVEHFSPSQLSGAPIQKLSMVKYGEAVSRRVRVCFGAVAEDYVARGSTGEPLV
ncbi:uncharacterized protein BBA_07770 [Beauveria bassiana ARSEF 2860]|uniref:GED domain-containing protein n=1 Tax=Beauveria bassiana (strain ARSEF 2860) TaxID=655819 RepID=J5JJ77_BEAB2|nr:uncharacterized protein BBA_07770 [Beauveria bassiana ARSEF 2860]EJP63376.1 hypothetical protein BBA_07770 [Beauveria bassiana ARSEF 2860]